MSSDAQKKAAKSAANAAKGVEINPEDIANKARAQAGRNLADSIYLERAYLPGQTLMRDRSLAELLGQTGSNKYMKQALADVSAQMGLSQEDVARSPLLQSAFQKAGEDLALGGQLDTDTQNMVTRRGLAQAGRVGGGELGQARAIVPRDLGLTSMQVQQQRLANAGQFGQIEQGLNQQDFQNTMAGRSTQAALASQLAGLAGQDFSRYMQMAQFGQSLQSPTAGLDPGQFATLYLQNATNMAQSGVDAAKLQSAGAANTANMWGQVAGQDWGKIISGIGGMFNKGGTTTTAPAGG